LRPGVVSDAVQRRTSAELVNGVQQFERGTHHLGADAIAGQHRNIENPSRGICLHVDILTPP
jgi:hypothetical protein